MEIIIILHNIINSILFKIIIICLIIYSKNLNIIILLILFYLSLLIFDKKYYIENYTDINNLSDEEIEKEIEKLRDDIQPEIGFI